MLMALTNLAFSVQPTVKILTEEEITKLSDKDLLNAYIDVAVEIQAQTSLHAASGYMPKEYESYKELLRYRVLLINEIKKRKLEVPETQ